MFDPSERCHLCNESKPMTQEHVPPSSAFNKGRWIEADARDALDLPPGQSPRGRFRQGGIWLPTLCADCNSFTGREYGDHYRHWAQGCASVLGELADADIQSESPKPEIGIRNTNFRRVLKQVGSMFLSVNDLNFRESDIGGELAAFVLLPAAEGLPEGLRVYTYLNRDGSRRYLPVQPQCDLATGRWRARSEIAFPPCGWLMTTDDDLVDARLLNITGFASMPDAPGEMDATIAVLPTHSFIMAGDYRSWNEVIAPFVEPLAESEEESSV